MAGSKKESLRIASKKNQKPANVKQFKERVRKNIDKFIEDGHCDHISCVNSNFIKAYLYSTFMQVWSTKIRINSNKNMERLAFNASIFLFRDVLENRKVQGDEIDGTKLASQFSAYFRIAEPTKKQNNGKGKN